MKMSTVGADESPVYSLTEMRWAAAGLSVGALLFVSGIVLGLEAFAGNWDRSIGLTLSSTAAVIHEKWNVFRWIWFGEMCAAILIAGASLILGLASSPTARRGPRAFLWILVGIGSILVAAQYAFTLGSYPPALAAFEQEPVLFAAVRGGVLMVSAVGSVLQLAGLIVILFMGFRWRGAALADRLIQAAVMIVLLGIALSATGMIAGELGAAAVFFAAAILGATLWLGSGQASGQPHL